MKDSIYLISKMIITIIAITIMCFAAHIWLGTQEGWDKALETNFWKFFFARLSLTLLVGLPFLGVSLWLNKQHLANHNLLKYAFFEFTILLVTALILVGKTIF